MKRFLYKVKTWDGRYLSVEANSGAEAIHTLGLADSEVRYFLPVRLLDKPQMDPETKEKLRVYAKSDTAKARRRARARIRRAGK